MKASLYAKGERKKTKKKVKKTDPKKKLPRPKFNRTEKYEQKMRDFAKLYLDGVKQKLQVRVIS